MNNIQWTKGNYYFMRDNSIERPKPVRLTGHPFFLAGVGLLFAAMFVIAIVAGDWVLALQVMATMFYTFTAMALVLQQRNEKKFYEDALERGGEVIEGLRGRGFLMK